jgi:hypothetical protein
MALAKKVIEDFNTVYAPNQEVTNNKEGATGGDKETLTGTMRERNETDLDGEEESKED